MVVRLPRSKKTLTTFACFLTFAFYFYGVPHRTQVKYDPSIQAKRIVERENAEIAKINRYNNLTMAQSARQLVLTETHETCPYGFNIYVYELDSITNGQDFIQEMLTYRGPFCHDDCSDAQFSTEIHIWRYLLKSPCRTKDPEKAHLFFLPFQETLQSLTWDGHPKLFQTVFDAFAERKYADVEEQLGITSKWMERYHGLDHVLTLATPPFYEHLLTATLFRDDSALVTLLLPELEIDVLKHKQETGNENVIIMPYPVLNEPWMPIRKTKEVKNRRYLASGLFGLHGDGEKARRNLIKMAKRSSLIDELAGRLLVAEYTGASEKTKEGPGFDNARLMENSIFCLSPAGDSLSTRRLFNAMFVGCIPVLFGDALILPFHRTPIPYDKFVLRLPLSWVETEYGGPRLFTYLMRLAKDGTALKMQEALFENLPKLAFNLPFPEVPTFPYDETVEALHEKTGKDAFDALMTELGWRAREIAQLRQKL